MTVKKIKPISFESSQGNLGDDYYVYIIDLNGHVSCFFWFDTISQFIASIAAYGDFWMWGNDWTKAKEKLESIVKLVQSNEISDEKGMNMIAKYMGENAGLSLYAWGSFSQLCNGNDEFSKEIRSDFRNSTCEEDGCDNDIGNSISIKEVEEFLEYLAGIPT
jgi:hypothetical protein